MVRSPGASDSCCCCCCWWWWWWDGSGGDTERAGARSACAVCDCDNGCVAGVEAGRAVWLPAQPATALVLGRRVSRPRSGSAAPLTSAEGLYCVGACDAPAADEPAWAAARDCACTGAGSGASTRLPPLGPAALPTTAVALLPVADAARVLARPPATAAALLPPAAARAAEVGLPAAAAAARRAALCCWRPAAAIAANASASSIRLAVSAAGPPAIAAMCRTPWSVREPASPPEPPRPAAAPAAVAGAPEALKDAPCCWPSATASMRARCDSVTAGATRFRSLLAPPGPPWPGMAAPAPTPAPAVLLLPGACRFGGIRARTWPSPSMTNPVAEVMAAAGTREAVAGRAADEAAADAPAGRAAEAAAAEDADPPARRRAAAAAAADAAGADPVAIARAASALPPPAPPAAAVSRATTGSTGPPPRFGMPPGPAKPPPRAPVPLLLPLPPASPVYPYPSSPAA